MAIIVGWGNVEEDLVVWRFENHWTTADYYHALRTSNELIESKLHDVQIICDMRYTRLFGVNLLQLAKTGFKHRPANLGQLIVVTSSNFMPTLYEKLQAVYPWMRMQMYFVSSVDDAYELLERFQASS